MQNIVTFMAIAAGLLWNLFNGLRTGKIYLGYITHTRTRDPVFFWIDAVISAVLGFSALYFFIVDLIHA